MKDLAKVFAIVVLLLGVLAIPRGAAHAAGVCPAVGQDTDCGIIITITNDGATVTSTGQGPFDGIEDTLVGVVNNSKLPIHALGLKSALPIFTFDGDGIDTFGIAGNAQDSTGYGGPNAFFANIDPSLTSGTVKFINPIPAKGGTDFFSLEDAVANAISCQDAIKKSVKVQANGANIDATFTPNLGLTLAQAAELCGFKTFDWIQKVTHQADPSEFFARNLGGAFRSNVNGHVRLTSATTPYSDPPQGGGYDDGNPPDFSFPFYYDPNNDLPQHQTATGMTFHDAPSDGCLPHGFDAGTAKCDNTSEPAGSFGGYSTRLAGVNFDGTAKNLGNGFTWTSNYNGTTGGVHIRKTDQPADNNGTGGVTITSIQDDPTYNYNGITVTSLNDGPVGPTPSLLVYTSPSLIANGLPATLTAQLTTQDSDPISGESVTLTLGSDPNAQSCTGTSDATGAVSCSITVSQPLGPNTVTASFAGDDSFLASSTTGLPAPLVFAYTNGGAFTVGNQSAGNAPVGQSATFWGAQWAKNNQLSGGSAPGSFKGFENSLAPPVCGTSWTSGPGNSSAPPSSVPTYTAVIVSSTITKSGSSISGNTVSVVIVKVDPGYAPDPGHAGTGTIVAVLC